MRSTEEYGYALWFLWWETGTTGLALAVDEYPEPEFIQKMASLGYFRELMNILENVIGNTLKFGYDS